MNMRQTSTPGTGNIDARTVASFGDEWSKYDQSELHGAELQALFEGYFRIFPWQMLPDNAEGFDMGCGSGRWAKLVAPRVGVLNCIDASSEALAVAQGTLADQANTNLINAPTDSVPLEKASQDFGYSLGVLHHIPDTQAAMNACTELLKTGAPFLIYLYYRFDNRPAWFRTMWKLSDLIRAVVSRLPRWAKSMVTDVIAALIYWPLARAAGLGNRISLDTGNWPLHFYRDSSFYAMRTDSRDRFGTPLEQRFTRAEIRAMMEQCGLRDITFSDQEPYWCAIGVKV